MLRATKPFNESVEAPVFVMLIMIATPMPVGYVPMAGVTVAVYAFATPEAAAYDVKLLLIAFITNCVVAICVVLVPDDAVVAVGAPVKAGELVLTY